MMPDYRRILRPSEVVKRTGISKSTIWRKEQAGEFPARRQLGGNSVGYFEDEIQDWQDSLPVLSPESSVDFDDSNDEFEDDFDEDADFEGGEFDDDEDDSDDWE